MNLLYALLLYLLALAIVIFFNKYLFPEKIFQRKYIISIIMSVLYYGILNFSYNFIENKYLLDYSYKYMEFVYHIGYILSNGILGLWIRKAINKKKKVKEIAL